MEHLAASVAVAEGLPGDGLTQIIVDDREQAWTLPGQQLGGDRRAHLVEVDECLLELVHRRHVLTREGRVDMDEVAVGP